MHNVSPRPPAPQTIDRPRPRALALQGRWIVLALLLAAPLLAVSPHAAPPLEVEVRVDPGAEALLLDGSALITECPRAKLRPSTPPNRGTLERAPAGRLRYLPSAAFWSVGGDTLALSVQRCRATRGLLVHVEAGANGQVAAVGSSAGPAWSLTDPGRRITVQGSTFAEDLSEIYILPGHAPATLDIEPPVSADDGQSNGGSLIITVDVDDDGDPIGTDDDIEARVVLWRAETAAGAAVAELSLENAGFVLEIEGTDGRYAACSTPYRPEARDFAIEWWYHPDDGGGRLRIDGVAECAVRGLATAGAPIAEHRLGDLDGTAFFPIGLGDFAFGDGLAVGRRSLAGRGLFTDLESWGSAPGEGWSLIPRRYGLPAWAALDAGTVFGLDLGARTGLPWVVEVGLDSASATGSGPFAVWRLVDDRPLDRLRLEVDRSLDGDRVRLVGLDARFSAVVSDWAPLPPGRSSLAIQGRPGEDSDLARLWIGDQVAVELRGIVFGSPTEQHYGLSSDEAAGVVEVGPLVSWVDQR